jgi:Rieske 2Fe-2S family protein
MSERATNGAGPDFTPTFRPVTQASHPPGMIYNDPAILEREKEVIFRQEWLCIGRADELPNPGDYQTHRIVGEPVLLCRKADGSIAAYSNTCLHRGVEVASGQGNTQEFTCPYHGWLYNLDGQLLGASYMRDSEGFDRRTCRLPTLPVALWHGWIFLSLNANPMPFDRYIADFDEKFGYIDMGKLKLGLKRDIPLRCNWKLMVENFIDFYHVGVLHKDTIGRYMKTSDVDYDLRPGGRIFIDEYDAGSHTKDGQVFKEPIATLKDKPPRFSQAGVLPPNLNFFVRPDYVMLYTSWPTDVDHMVMKQYVCFPAHVRDAADFPQVIADFTRMSDKILGEDVDMVESLQNASKARHFVPGRMSRLERGVQHYIRHNIERIFGGQQEGQAAE